MSFQIQTPEGVAMPINELDKEACEFWNVEQDPKYYAHPDLPKHYTNNWFDTIGWAIHHPENYTTGWNDVKCTLWTIQAKSLYEFLNDQEKMMATIAGIEAFLAPYFDLIDHWESKGYIPVQVDDKTK